MPKSGGCPVVPEQSDVVILSNQATAYQRAVVHPNENYGKEYKLV